MTEQNANLATQKAIQTVNLVNQTAQQVLPAKFVTTDLFYNRVYVKFVPKFYQTANSAKMILFVVYVNQDLY